MSEPNREKEIFEQALDIESLEKRAAFIIQACEGDAALIQRIHALLRAHETAPDFLSEKPDRSASTISDEVPLEGPGTVIGRYKLLELIGEGGFGYVFMAEQLEPVKRRVALKILKPGMDSKQVIGRFEAERQALALMDHPNIAQIYDAGTTDGRARHSVRAGVESSGSDAQKTDAPYLSYGRPYFVMELVRGVPITKFCEQQELDLEARLNLFIQVCSAVQHAHQKGVIHRDLKPSNILVTLHGEEPVPKVIDFGIAKATQQPLTEKTVFTQFQQFLGTPAYMSPEQATMSGVDVDTRSDIYSLGVLLYELLTGSPPFETKELLSVGLDEMRRIIREKDPERPSTRLSRSLVGADVRRLKSKEEKREEERASSRRLLQGLKGDLDWIVMKALEKDRARRYETANGLAVDLKRYLNLEPVVARPPSKLYEFQKTVRRHKFGFGATAAIIMVLLAGVLVSSWQAHRANRSAQIAMRETKVANTQRHLAEAAQKEASARAETLADQVYRMHIERANIAANNGDTEIARRQLDQCDTTRRNWEWNYLYDTLPHETVMPTTGTILFLSNGQLLARGLNTLSSGLFRFDPASGKVLGKVLQADYEVNFARSSDGTRYATSSPKRLIGMWNSKGRKLWSIQGHNGNLSGLEFSPHGRELASCTYQRLKVWNVADGSLVRQFKSVQKGIHTPAFFPDALKVATPYLHYATGVSGLEVWDIKTGMRTNILKEVGWPITGVLFTRDGTRLITTCSANRTVAIWDAKSLQNIRTFAAPVGNIHTLALDADDSKLAVGGSAGIGIFDLATGEEIQKLRMPWLTGCWALAWGPHDRWLAASISATGSFQTHCWDLAAPAKKPLPQHHGRVWSIAFSPDGKKLVSASADHTVTIWNAISGTPERSFQVNNSGTWAMRTLAFDPDGKYIILATGKTLLRRWNLQTTKPVMDYSGATEENTCAAISPNRRWLAAGSRDGIVRVWNYQTGSLRFELRGHYAYDDTVNVSDVKFSPDGSLIASAGSDRTVRLWDVSSGHLVRILHASKYSPLLSVAFTPDGRRVLAGGEFGNSLYIWQTANGKLLNTLSGIHDNNIWGLAISPDGKRMASGGQGGLWAITDADTDNTLLTEDSGQGSIWDLAWSPDGRTIATAGGDGTVKFWRGALPATNHLAGANTNLQRVSN